MGMLFPLEIWIANSLKKIVLMYSGIIKKKDNTLSACKLARSVYDQF